MISNSITAFCDTLIRYLFEAKGVCEQGKKQNGVWWVVRDGDWFRPCWVTFTEYSPACIRVKTGTNPGIPKRAWPHKLPEAGGPYKFELTFHESELTEATAGLVFACCSKRDFHFESPLFSETEEVPHYAWSLKAEKHHEEWRRKKR